jgi:histidyl-tRNA synthetase
VAGQGEMEKGIFSLKNMKSGEQHQLNSQQVIEILMQYEKNT